MPRQDRRTPGLRPRRAEALRYIACSKSTCSAGLAPCDRPGVAQALRPAWASRRRRPVLPSPPKIPALHPRHRSCDLSVHVPGRTVSRGRLQVPRPTSLQLDDVHAQTATHLQKHHDRQPYLVPPQAGCRWCRIRNYCDCFIPDHLHLLTEGLSEDADLRRFVHEFKQRSAFEYKRAAGQPLWQARYHDHVLRNDEATKSVAGYIIQNPVRAGLVEDPRRYPFLGSEVYAMEDLLESVRR